MFLEPFIRTSYIYNIYLNLITIMRLATSDPSFQFEQISGLYILSMIIVIIYSLWHKLIYCFIQSNFLKARLKSILNIVYIKGFNAELMYPSHVKKLINLLDKQQLAQKGIIT